MVGEFSKGSLRHRGHTATTSAICLRPAAPLAYSWCLLTAAFTGGVVVTLVLVIWWLFSLDD